VGNSFPSDQSPRDNDQSPRDNDQSPRDNDQSPRDNDQRPSMAPIRPPRRRRRPHGRRRSRTSRPTPERPATSCRTPGHRARGNPQRPNVPNDLRQSSQASYRYAVADDSGAPATLLLDAGMLGPGKHAGVDRIARQSTRCDACITRHEPRSLPRQTSSRLLPRQTPSPHVVGHCLAENFLDRPSLLDGKNLEPFPAALT
jgi:hypothetical protein